MDPIEAALQAFYLTGGSQQERMKVAIKAYNREMPEEALIKAAKALVLALAGERHWDQLGPSIQSIMRRGAFRAVEAYEARKLEGGTGEPRSD
jgi:hypothetical protein